MLLLFFQTGRAEEAMAADLKSLELSLHYRRSLGGGGGAGGGGASASAAAGRGEAAAASPGLTSEPASRGAGTGDVRNSSKAVLV
jgi:hypothetical protein